MKRFLIVVVLTVALSLLFTGCMIASATGNDDSSSTYMPFATLTVDDVECVTLCSLDVETVETLNEEAVEDLVQILNQIVISKESRDFIKESLEKGIIWLGGYSKFYVLELTNGTRMSIGAFCARSIDSLFYMGDTFYACENQNLLAEMKQKHDEQVYAYYEAHPVKWNPRPSLPTE